jgi:hypothetical protein
VAGFFLFKVNMHLFRNEQDVFKRLGNLTYFLALESGIFFGSSATCALNFESLFKPSTDA